MLRYLFTLFGIALITSAYAQDLQNGLIACYSFSGNANDGTGNQNNGTVNGATLTTDRFGNANSAYYFNGTTTCYITIPSSQLKNNNFSYSAWANASTIPSPGNNGTVFSIGDDVTSRHQSMGLGNSFASAALSGWGGGGWNTGATLNSSIQTGVLPNTNQWYHLVLTRNATVMTFYLNGQLIGTSPTDGNAFYGSSTTANIGVRCTYIQPFNGKVDDFSIYNREITQQEVTLLYQNGLACSPIPSPPTANGIALCGSGTAVLTASGGTAYRWYDALTGGNLLFEGNPFTTPNLSSTTDYYVCNVENNVESIRVKVTATITPMSVCCPTPTASGIAICGSSTTVLTASGGTAYRWYDALTGGNFLFEGNPFTTPQLSVSTDYYVANFQNNKESVRIKVTVTVNPQPQLTCNFPEEYFLFKDITFTTAIVSGTAPFQYTFNFGDGDQLTTSKSETIYTYPSAGTYSVSVSVNDANGCKSACSSPIEILDDPFIPNVITVNADTLNDRLTLFFKKGNSFVQYQGSDSFSLLIIDRWGKEVYKTTDPIDGWDGKDVAVGVYFYSMTLGTRHFKGWVSILL